MFNCDGKQRSSYVSKTQVKGTGGLFSQAMAGKLHFIAYFAKGSYDRK